MFVRSAQLLMVVACLSVAIGGLGRWHFIFDLASHFRIQATFSCFLAAGVLVLCRAWRSASIATLVAVCLLATLVPYFRFPQLTSPRPSLPAFDQQEGATGLRQPLRVLTFNVLTSNRRVEDVVEWSSAVRADVMVFLETDQRWVKNLEQAFRDNWTFRMLVPRSDNFGISVFSRRPWRSAEVVSYSQFDLPAISIQFEPIDDKQINLIAVHPLPPTSSVKWQDRNGCFATLSLQLSAWDASRSIVVGDLNCSPWSPWFQQFLADSTLRDSALGMGLPSTWYPLSEWMTGLPIDHALVGRELQVVRRFVGPNLGSDHRPVVVDVR